MRRALQRTTVAAGAALARGLPRGLASPALRGPQYHAQEADFPEDFDSSSARQHAYYALYGAQIVERAPSPCRTPPTS